jgi:hypothetical protein
MRRILIGTLILVGSLIFLYQGLVPALLWFMDTELATKLFYTTTPEEADNKDRSMLALDQCKAYAQQEFEEGSVITFHSQDSKDLKVWKVINDYIVRSRLEIQNPSSPEMPHKYLYACKLRYTGGDDTQQANWTLLGFDLSKPEPQKLEGAGPAQPRVVEPKPLGTDE